ncbi:MAG: SGNH/GDSL hydrolase family protein [Nostocoides sp.]
MQRGMRTLVGAVATALAVVAGSAAAQASPSPTGQAHAMGYYVALGDSLAAGYQPGVGDDKTGGYAGHVLDALRTTMPKTRLVNLACSGETTGTMMAGGICSYRGGSQLTQAVAFLHAHGKFTRLVTIDIGANDVDGCVSAGGISRPCVEAGLRTIGAKLPMILGQLRAAAGPGVRIQVLNYYDPFLAAWLTGPDGQTAAAVSLQLSAVLNAIIAGDSASIGGTTVDIATAFNSQDQNTVLFPPFGQVPVNVVTICQLTWMCTLNNIHANDAGYAVMGAAVAATL